MVIPRVRLLAILLIFACVNQLATYANQTYDAAYRLQKQGQHEAAVRGFLNAEQEAQKQGDALTRFSSFYCASYSAHALSRNTNCIDYAEKALAISEENAKVWARRSKQPLFEVELIGLIERSHFSLARLGQGWQSNRRGVHLLRKHYGSPKDGYLTPEEVLRFPRSMRSQGWRFIEREATYLHETGHTSEARKLLESAIDAAKPDLRTGSYHQSFYAIKLVGALALIEGFVGNEERAIKLTRQELGYAKRWPKLKNHIRIRLNLLSSIVDYQGANDAIIAEAGELLANYEAGGYNGLGSAKRMYDRICAGKMSDEARIEQLIEAAHMERSEEKEIENFYASRNELFIRAARNDPELDEEFHQFLIRTREQGNLRAEPRIYRHYADWLHLQTRYPEAIRMYKIALSRSRLSEWHPQVVNIYGKLAASYLTSGQEAQAFKTMAEMQAYFDQHPDTPAYAMMRAVKHWLMALLSTGRTELAHEVAAKWARFARERDVPAIHLTAFSDQFIDTYLAKLSPTHQEVIPDELKTFLHPVSITTVGIPGQAAQSALFLLNPSAQSDQGFLKVTGVGLSLSSVPAGNPTLIQQKNTSHITKLSIPLSINGGDLHKVYIHSENEAEQSLQFEWQSQNHTDSRTAIWNYSIDDPTNEAIIMEAAEIQYNPYIGIPAEHTVYFPESTPAHPTPFRIRSDAPFRIEYRDPTDGRILAIDNNGNGDLSETGDFWIPAERSATAAPHLNTATDVPYSSIEVWYFPNEATTTKTLNLHVELMLQGEWITQAVDQIRLATTD